MHPETEFNRIEYIRGVLGDHKSWLALENIIKNGVSYPTTEMDEPARKEKLAHNLEKGNHAGQEGDEQWIDNFISEELKKGYMIPLLATILEDLPHEEICPVLITQKGTIGDNGESTIKYRLCHDLSYYRRDGIYGSVNGRHDIAALLSIQYRFTLSRFIQGLATMQENNPGKKILLMKFDADLAFKRLGLSLHSALKTIILHRQMTMMSTRMMFGGKSSSNN